MQSHVWAAVVSYIPAEIQDKLMLLTVGGTEICLQSFLRIDREFMVVKGRLSGSQEAGRIFFVPYAQIEYLGTQQPWKDSDYEEVFGRLVTPADLPVPVPRTAAPAERPPSVVGLPTGGSTPAPAVSTIDTPTSGSGVRPVVRSVVLERFRARNGSSAMVPPPTDPNNT
jgi:hypothetical protein